MAVDPFGSAEWTGRQRRHVVKLQDDVNGPMGLPPTSWRKKLAIQFRWAAQRKNARE